MAAMRAHEASSSKSRFMYHVFLSFRGKDTQKTFTGHLYIALLNAGILTFRDDDELEKGENIEAELQKAIQRSKILLIVFSKEYASSRWCLEELVKILECKKTGNEVLPVFYNVDPIQVRNQTGSFEEEFVKHEQRFEAEKVIGWRVALKEVADLQGPTLLNQLEGYESKFIQDIVKEIAKRLKRTVLRVAPHPVGIDTRVKHINSWLQDGSMDVGILAIYGIGGIGKTTIAKAVYNLNFDEFDGSSFLANIREASEQPYGLVRLQRQLLSNILRKKVRKFYNVDEGIIKIKDAICCKRILLVLDDVDDLDQLNAVLGIRQWFHPGSKVMITTRHERLLQDHEECEMYQIKQMNYKESLQLFSWHAFGQECPVEAYEDLSTNVVYHCGGIPLALQVLGSSLSGSSTDVWKSALEKLKAIPDTQILRKLRISYESLPDDHDKNLFLDIACFFVGKDRDYAITILECDFYAIVGIQNLIDRCLLTFDHKNKLVMHHLLRDMGREIIFHESPHPGKRSRIWQHKDSFNVLKQKTGTETIKGLVLDMRVFKEVKQQRSSAGKFLLADQGCQVKRRRLDFTGRLTDYNSEGLNYVEFKTDAFVRMHNLRLLQLSYIQLSGCYEKLPETLIWIYWRGFPLKYIPEEFPLENLVALDMRNSSLEQVWKGIKFLGLLKILNLSHSHGLIRTPDFSGLPDLKTLILKDCIRLTEIHESIRELNKLVILNLKDCRNLRRLPSNLDKLKSLEKLIISGCKRLVIIPLELVNLESLTMLHADETGINQLVRTSLFRSWISSPGTSSGSKKFSLASLSNSLASLSLANCNLSDYAISVDLSHLTLLQYLNLSGNSFHTLPPSIKNLHMLRDLWVDDCTGLQSLPELPSSLIDLKAVDCTSLESITNLPNLLESLFLDVSGCNKLVEVEKFFRLEFLGNFDAVMLKNLGILCFESIRNVEVELFNKMTETRMKVLIQGLNEFGIFSTNIPGSKIPDWFSSSSTGDTVLFTVPSNPETMIRGLNVSIVYSRSRSKTYQYWSNPKHGGWYVYYIRINNKTKGLKWVYSPTFIGIPGENEDITFLSHWKLGNKLEDGDEVEISVVGLSKTILLKGLGISLVYDNQEEKNDAESMGNSSYSSYKGLVDLDLSVYQLSPHAYFLSHPNYLIVRSSVGDETKETLCRHLLGDSATQINLSKEGGEEEVESDYDYSDADDKEIMVELEELLAEPDWWR